MDDIVIQRRITSTLLQAIPPQIEQFNAYLYLIVPRRPDQIIDNECDIKLDPCVLDWDTKTITITIPAEINPGITSVDDLDPDFYEAIQVAFLSLMYACI